MIRVIHRKKDEKSEILSVTRRKWVGAVAATTDLYVVGSFAVDMNLL